MALNAAAKNAMLDHLASLIGFASLHTADPGAGGTSEVTGGSPAYARKAVAWNAAATSSLTANVGGTPIVFDVPGGPTSITHLGYWSLVSAGTFYGSRPLSGGGETFNNQGTYTVTAITENLTDV